jgi:hypothetical protein
MAIYDPIKVQRIALGFTTGHERLDIIYIAKYQEFVNVEEGEPFRLTLEFRQKMHVHSRLVSDPWPVKQCDESVRPKEVRCQHLE